MACSDESGVSAGACRRGVDSGCVRFAEVADTRLCRLPRKLCKSLTKKYISWSRCRDTTVAWASVCAHLVADGSVLNSLATAVAPARDGCTVVTGCPYCAFGGRLGLPVPPFLKPAGDGS